MEFSDRELEAIERACGLQAYQYREDAKKLDRPMMRNQRIEWAEELERIVKRIEEDRRIRALRARQCTNCDE